MLKLSTLGYNGYIYVNPNRITAMEAKEDPKSGRVLGTIIYFDWDNDVMVSEMVDDIAKLIPAVQA